MSVLTRINLSEILSKELGFEKSLSKRFIEELFETLSEHVDREQLIKIAGFGSFLTRDKLPRSGRNPQNGQEMLIEARRIVSFKPGKKLKEKVNEFSDSKGSD